MLVKYFFVGGASAVVSAVCLYFALTSNLFGHTIAPIQQGNPYVNEDRFEDNPYIYKDSYYAYKNWKVKVANVDIHEMGSLISIGNTKNPVNIIMTDNDSNQIERVTISHIRNGISLTCNLNRMSIFFNQSNDIKSISLYEGNSSNVPKYKVKLILQNGQWKIVERTEANCV